MVVDPYHNRESKKYKNSIPSRECIALWLKKNKHLTTQKSIEKKFGIHSKEEKKALRRRLRAMERDGEIIYAKNRCYITPENLKIIEGKVIGHRDGYGFLRTETLKDDLWLSAEQMKLCIHGDIILAHILNSDKKGRSAARVLKVLKPNNVLIVGRYYINNNMKFIIPDDLRFNFKIFIDASFKKNIIIGSIVVVKLNKHPFKKNKAQGSIIEVLGIKMGTKLAINIALRTHSIPYIWSSEVRAQILNIHKKSNSFNIKNRVDLRDLPFFTIDGEDAYDFDDAIYCKKKIKKEEGWNLWVAISDVSHFVKPNSALDISALERGNSVYFPSLVIPMLPKKISTDLCSLKPHVERLCLVCQMHLSNTGMLISYQHYEAVICSKGRFTYDEIFRIWNGDVKLRLKHKMLLNAIDNLSTLQKILDKYKELKKNIYFENIEPKFILDSTLRICRIYQNVRNDAHKFIESCMILANIASASFINQYKYPALFRNHDQPSISNIISLRAILKEFGLSLLGEEQPESIHYINLLKEASMRPDYDMIQTILLRSMKQAVYSPENRGHFGLSLSSYVHFTSPIRRYPDIVVHRVIKSLLLQGRNNLLNTKNNLNFNYVSVQDMKKLGAHCSVTERRADDAVRDVMDWLKCDFMQKKIGCVLNGVISNVTSFGFFVRLQPFLIDGLVHITSLVDDYYYFDSLGLRLIGKSHRKTYRLGDRLNVKIVSIDFQSRKIELSL